MQGHQQEDLVTILVRLGKQDLSSLYPRLLAEPIRSPLWQDIIHTLTVGETYFMRDQQHFETLSQHILPQIRENYPDHDELNVWSVGCSSGEEPYSLAIRFEQLKPLWQGKVLNIQGFDINQRSLQQAREGRYRDWSFRHTDADFRQMYFNQSGDQWQIKAQYREMVNFELVNFLDTPWETTAHIIFCRHLLLYLLPEYRIRMEQILYDALEPEGWLYIGQSEALHGNRSRWKMHILNQAPLYQKKRMTLLNPRPSHKGTGKLSRKLPVDTKQLDQFQFLYGQAVDAFHQGNDILTREIINILLEEYPRSATVRIFLGALFASQRATEEALLHLKLALEFKPLNADAYYLLGLVALENDDEDEARHALHRARYCDVTHPLASVLLANIYLQDGDLSRSIRLLAHTKQSLSVQDPEAFVKDYSLITIRQLLDLIDQQSKRIQAKDPKFQD
ncbi:protein-glutamate O-methyltransferase CheR [Anaerolineales bacterium]